MSGNRKKRGVWKPTPFERAVVSIIGSLFIFNGAYLVGPWYLTVTDDGAQAPLFSLFNSDTAVQIYGVLLLVDGLALLFASGVLKRMFNARIVRNAVLAGFLLRLYSLIGVFLTLESWRPPSYASHTATVMITAALWLWIRFNERPTE